MNITTAYSSANESILIIDDILNQIGTIQPKLIIFFASSSINPHTISRHFKSNFPDSEIIGCSTAGELVSGKFLENSVVAMFLDDEVIEDIHIEVVANISDENRIPEAFNNFEKHFNIEMKKLDFEKYVGLIFIDGLRGAEEKIMEQINKSTNVKFIGGSAGDDLHFNETFVYVNGFSFTNSAVLTILKVKNGFDFIKTQSFRPTNKSLTATKVNESERIVLEFNNIPAAKAYAQSIGCKINSLPKKFISNPLGIMIGNEPYVRSPQRVINSGLKFYGKIMEGTELKLLEATDIIKDTKDSIQNILDKYSKISGIISFNCILRTLELKELNKTDEYSRLFSNIPTIGFSTYGEEFYGHINQTETMLIFK